MGSEKYINVDKLRSLLGAHLQDPVLAEWLSGVPINPEIIRDYEDGAEEEYWEFYELGFGLCFSAGKLNQVALHSGTSKDSYKKYGLDLIGGATFDSREEDIVSLFGQPSDTGGGTEGFFGAVPRWVKYHYSDCSVHFEFRENGQVARVTLAVQ